MNNTAVVILILFAISCCVFTVLLRWTRRLFVEHSLDRRIEELLKAHRELYKPQMVVLPTSVCQTTELIYSNSISLPVLSTILST